MACGVLGSYNSDLQKRSVAAACAVAGAVGSGAACTAAARDVRPYTGVVWEDPRLP